MKSSKMDPGISAKVIEVNIDHYPTDEKCIAMPGNLELKRGDKVIWSTSCKEGIDIEFKDNSIFGEDKITIAPVGNNALTVKDSAPVDQVQKYSMRTRYSSHYAIASADTEPTIIIGD